jgi:methylenetetrahydrofolate/methylenetetrahydromethanopterin dehydrogenase (NADP+)
MSKPKILIQLDPDKHASVFDAVVAVDSGVDQLLQYERVAPGDVRDLVYGAMFTRGPDTLSSTAIFIGGSDVGAGEELLRQARECFFGPIRVSILLDSNGANTTAAAAVLSAARHVELAEARTLVLAGTGPVGLRVAHLLTRQGAQVRLASRVLERAEQACHELRESVQLDQFTPVSTASPHDVEQALEGVQVVVSAGAAGVCLLPRANWSPSQGARAGADLKVMVDLNAVPPLGIEGVDARDAGKVRDGVLAYGALGVGQLKMKIHKAAVRQLFEANDQVLDAEEVFAIGQKILANG